MQKNNYPRVLVLGHQFNDKTGIGITLSNLFYDWPNERIGVMCPKVYTEDNEKSRPCGAYIGKPINSVQSTKIQKNYYFKNSIKHFYVNSGIIDFMYKLSYTPAQIEEAKDYNPDILFCCLGSQKAMKDCLAIKEQLPDAKLVLYILDDWVNTKESDRLFSYYWKRKNDKYFRELLDKASGLLSICQSMSDAYLEKYGKTFIPFHNPVDVNQWLAVRSIRKYRDNEKSIIYAGKINKDTKDCLIDFAAVIDKLNKQGHSFVFDVYTPNYDENANVLASFTGSHVFPSIPHSEVASVTKSYDASLLTLGFSEKTKKYVKLSMSTKVSEVLASGIPTILYCPQDIALAKYLVGHECVISCVKRDNDCLAQAVKKLLDKSSCEHIVTKALLLAKEHDNTVVRERFRRTLESF